MTPIKLICVLLLLLQSPWAFSKAPGESLPAYELTDETGAEHVLGTAVRRIYATTDRKGDKLLAAAMESRDQTTLDTQSAVVIADISEAPGFVKRIIRSSLKDRSYRSWLDLRGSTRSTLPARADGVTVIDLDQRRIREIRHITDQASLETLLDEKLLPLPSPAPEPTLETP